MRMSRNGRATSFPSQQVQRNRHDERPAEGRGRQKGYGHGGHGYDEGDGGEAGPGVDANDVGGGEDVLCQALEDGSGDAESYADQEGDDDPGQAQGVYDEVVVAVLYFQAEYGLYYVWRGDRVLADADV